MNPKGKDYLPISCNLYDELTLLAMRKQKINIEYKNEENVLYQIETIIKDIYSEEGEEFILLDSKQIIRLDRLLKINGEDFLGTC